MTPLQSFAMASKKGDPNRMFLEGKAYPGSDPVVKKYPELFVALDDLVSRRGVQAFTATAAPGEPVAPPVDG